MPHHADWSATSSDPAVRTRARVGAHQETTADVRLSTAISMISIHDKAALAARLLRPLAREVLGDHDLLFERQAECRALMWKTSKMAAERAEELGEAERSIPICKAKPTQPSPSAGRRVKIGSPERLLTVNGEISINVPHERRQCLAIIALDLLEKIQFSECPPMALTRQNSMCHPEQRRAISSSSFSRLIHTVTLVYLPQWMFDGITFHGAAASWLKR